MCWQKRAHFIYIYIYRIIYIYIYVCVYKYIYIYILSTKTLENLVNLILDISFERPSDRTWYTSPGTTLHEWNSKHSYNNTYDIISYTHTHIFGIIFWLELTILRGYGSNHDMLISVIYTSIIYDNYMKRMQMKTYIFLNYIANSRLFSLSD